VRVGLGYDVHRLVAGRRLILGGVEVAYHLGLLGHSDADVLVHAICDALLGAAGLGDIGQHFPDDDPQYAGISSLKLLSVVVGLLAEHSLQPAQVDAVVLAEQPLLAPYIPSMRENIARVLKVDKRLVNIKATTFEGLGPIGQGQAIAAQAVATCIRREDAGGGEGQAGFWRKG